MRLLLSPFTAPRHRGDGLALAINHHVARPNLLAGRPASAHDHLMRVHLHDRLLRHPRRTDRSGRPGRNGAIWMLWHRRLLRLRLRLRLVLALILALEVWIQIHILLRRRLHRIVRGSMRCGLACRQLAPAGRFGCNCGLERHWRNNIFLDWRWRRVAIIVHKALLP